MTRFLFPPIFWVALLLALAVLGMEKAEPFFHWVFPDIKRVIYTRTSFSILLAYHFIIVATSSLISIAIGVGAGIFVTRQAGQDFLPIVRTIAAVGQTFPPIAVLGIAILLVGYGSAPILIALIIYGLLPIVENTIAGLAAVPPSVVEAAKAMGYSSIERLIFIELPLASPVILAGIRVSIIINIGTATIGSTVGARTLGAPIIEGLAGSNTAYIIQGAIVVGLFAIFFDMALGYLARRLPQI
ncbi:MAG: ABC transporter permease [Alphaproteobacteria bacterium]